MLSRREFLTALAASSSVLAAGCSSSGVAHEGPVPLFSYQDPGAETWNQTVCTLCPIGCPMDFGLKGGQIVSMKGVPTSPTNFGRVCAKGSLSYKNHVASTRAGAPMGRQDAITKGKKDGLKELPWDQALDQVTKAIKSAGPGGVFFYLGAQINTEAMYVWNKLAKGYLGTNNVDCSSRFTQVSTMDGLTAAFGTPTVPGSFADLDTADVIVLAGANPFDTHPPLWYRILANKRKRKAKIILIDPRISPSASAADVHLRPRPGTDAVVLHALAAAVIRKGGQNADYVGRFTTNYGDYEKGVSAYSPDVVRSLTGVPASELEKAANLLAEAKTFTTAVGAGIVASPGGAGAVQAAANLHLVTGQLGKPGSGLLVLAGASNGIGAISAGIYPHMIPGGRQVTDARHRAQVEGLWGVQGRISGTPGVTIPDLPSAVEQGRIKVLVVVGANPAVSMPGLDRWRSLMKNLFVVVVDPYQPTETSLYADIFLPAALATGESEGVVFNAERRAQLQEKSLTPPGGAKPDWEIAALLAQRLGYSNGFGYKAAAEVWDEWIKCSTGTFISQVGATRQRLKGTQGLQVPVPVGEHPGTPRLYADGKFSGISGGQPYTAGYRALLATPPSPGAAAAAAPAVTAAPTAAPPAAPAVKEGEKPADAKPAAPAPVETGGGFPFMLVTGRYLEHTNTRTRTGFVQELNYAAPRALLEVSRQDAANLGIKDNDWVEVTSRFGRLTVRARVTENVSEGQLFIPWQYGHLSDMEGSSDGRGDPEAAFNLLLTAGPGVNPRHQAVRIQKAQR